MLAFDENSRIVDYRTFSLNITVLRQGLQAATATVITSTGTATYTVTATVTASATLNVTATATLNVIATVT
jgi:hypothetical protein